MSLPQQNWVQDDASSLVPLGANQSFTGTGFSTLSFNALIVGVYADTAGKLFVEFSEDGGADNFWIVQRYDVPASNAVTARVSVKAAFARVRFECGVSAQSDFVLSTMVSAAVLQADQFTNHDIPEPPPAINVPAPLSNLEKLKAITQANIVGYF